MTLFLGMERELLVVDPQQPASAKRRLVDMQITSVAVDPYNPKRVYCGTFGRGLWRSDDGGDSWQPIADPGPAMRYEQTLTGIRSALILSVAVSAVEESNGFGVVFAGTEPAALYRSEDGGDTWRELAELRALPSSSRWSFPPRPDSNLVRWIAPHPGIPGALAVAIEAGALARSRDGGDSWTDGVPGGPFDTHTLVAPPLAPDRLYSAAGDGYYESEDGGDSWHKPMEGLPVGYCWSLAADPADPDTILMSASPSAALGHYLAGEARAGLYRKQNGPWSAVTEGLPEEAGTVLPILATHPAEPGTFYALSNKGLYRSVDTGLSWEALAVPWRDAYLGQQQQALAVSHP